MSSGTSRPPRFVSQTMVEVFSADRDELQVLWTENISAGGLFVRTVSPPPLGSHVIVELVTPDGALTLRAEIVRIVDAALAAFTDDPPGVALQFIDLTPDTQAAIEAYVEGVAERLEVELTGEPEDVRTLAEQLASGDLYAAFGVDPTIADDELVRAVDDVRELWAQKSQDLNPARIARVDAIRAQLERAARQLRDPAWRLRYDFRRGLVRAKDRIAATRGSLARLRELANAWAEVAGDDLAEAEFLAEMGHRALEAGRDHEALNLIDEALESDPFNPDLLMLRTELTGDVPWEPPPHDQEEPPAVEPRPATEVDPVEDARAKNAVGLMKFDGKRYEAARDLFRQAMDADPTNPEYKINLAWAMFRDAKFDREEAMKAPELIEEAIALTKDDDLLAKAHYYLGRIYRASEQPDEALKHFETALELDPQHQEAAQEVRLLALRAEKKATKKEGGWSSFLRLFRGKD